MMLPGVTASGRQVAPSVRTDAASSVVVSGGTKAQATLNGTILRAENSANTVVFHWGTSSTLTPFNVVSAPSVSQGSTNTAVNAALTDLDDGTVYYYRVVSTNTGGETRGSIVSFTTPINAPVATTGAGSDATTSPTATTGSASNYAKTTATFNGTHTGSTAYFQYSTTSNFSSGNNDTGSSTNTTLATAVSGLSGNTTYYFRIRSTNNNRRLTMNGTVNANNRSTTVVFRYSTSSTFATSATVTATQSPVTGTTNTAVSATVSGLAAGTYYFRVEATSAGGTTNGATSSGIAVSSKETIGGTSSFTTYNDRSTTYTTVGESIATWVYPSIPAGGAPVTSISVLCVGGGGGGGKGSEPSSAAGGGGGGGRVFGVLSVSNNNATITVGRGGTGRGQVTAYGYNGYPSSVTIGGASITANGGVAGSNTGTFNGGDSTYAGGFGYDDGYGYNRHGGGGGGSGGSGGSASSSASGNGGAGTSGQCGGGGGGGFNYSFGSGTYTATTGSGADGGGNAIWTTGGGAFTNNANNYGGGGGAGVNGLNGGNGYQGYVVISWVGP